MAQTPETLATSAARPGTIALGAAPVQVTLAPTRADVPLLQRLAARSGRKLYLVVRGLRTAGQPETLFQIYLGLPPGAAPKPDGPHYVGSFNFFNAPDEGAVGAARFYSYDVTDLVGALQSRKLLGDAVTVTIVPADVPAAAARPQVGEIALVEQ